MLACQLKLISISQLISISKFFILF